MPWETERPQHDSLQLWDLSVSVVHLQFSNISLLKILMWKQNKTMWFLFIECNLTDRVGLQKLEPALVQVAFV